MGGIQEGIRRPLAPCGLAHRCRHLLGCGTGRNCAGVHFFLLCSGRSEQRPRRRECRLGLRPPGRPAARAHEALGLGGLLAWLCWEHGCSQCSPPILSLELWPPALHGVMAQWHGGMYRAELKMRLHCAQTRSFNMFVPGPGTLTHTIELVFCPLAACLCHNVASQLRLSVLVVVLTHQDQDVCTEAWRAIAIGC